MTKSTGTINNSARVPNKRPPTVPVPTEILPFAPTPEANISGSMPKAIVAEVMIMGRKRAFAADMAEATSPSPSLRLAEAY